MICGLSLLYKRPNCTLEKTSYPVFIKAGLVHDTQNAAKDCHEDSILCVMFIFHTLPRMRNIQSTLKAIAYKERKAAYPRYTPM
jgi:hypothetical protein